MAKSIESTSAPKSIPRPKSHFRKSVPIIVFVAVVYATLLLFGEFRIENGNIYRVDAIFGSRIFIKHHYDTDYYRKAYEIIDGLPHVIGPDEERYPTRRVFREGFEGTDHISDLINLDRWMHFTVQSPSARSVPNYNRLRNQILKGESDFIDNIVSPSDERPHLGERSLKTYSVLPVSGMATCKASLSATLFHFTKGDEVWFSAWFFLESAGTYNTLMDLESTWIAQHPGMRIVLQDGYLGFQLAKWEPKRNYRQHHEKRVPIPIKKWVNIKCRLLLSEEQDGIVQLWQDDKLILDQTGKTLPFSDAVYDSLEIGLSAHSHGKGPALLYVDDISISDKPLN